jgi:hypothetical protein
LGWRRCWRGDGFRLRCARSFCTGSGHAVASNTSFSFGGTTFGGDHVLFSSGHLFGTAFDCAASGHAAFSIRYAPPLIGFG